MPAIHFALSTAISRARWLTRPTTRAFDVTTLDDFTRHLEAIGPAG